MNSPASISVIVPTRNRVQSLKSCLASLVRQKPGGRAFEVLVIDNGSSDDTRSATREFEKEHNSIRYFFEPRPGLHEGRHRGMKEATGEVLVFLDDDIEAQDGWLAAIGKTFDDPAIALAGGNNLPKFLA